MEELSPKKMGEGRCGCWYSKKWAAAQKARTSAWKAEQSGSGLVKMKEDVEAGGRKRKAKPELLEEWEPSK